MNKSEARALLPSAMGERDVLVDEIVSRATSRRNHLLACSTTAVTKREPVNCPMPPKPQTAAAPVSAKVFSAASLVGKEKKIQASALPKRSVAVKSASSHSRFKKNSAPPNIPLIALNQKKRDLRTIEDIMLDMRKEKPSSTQNTNSSSNKRLNPIGTSIKQPNSTLKEPAPTNSNNSASKHSLLPIGKSTLLTNTQHSKEKQAPKRAAASPSPTSSQEDEEYYKNNYSQIISKMFNYSKESFRDEMDELFDDALMEASFSDIEREESRSRSLAVQEDRREAAASASASTAKSRK